MQVTKQDNKSKFRLTAYSNGETVFDLNLEKKKSILGRGEKSDLFIEDNRISFYHAFIEVTPEGIKVMDLSSVNGTFLNGEQVESCFLAPGDRINFGGLEFIVNEEVIESAEVAIENDDDAEVVTVSQSEIVEKLPELTPKGDLVVIDGEYCDIKFNEADYQRSKSVSAYSQKVSKTDYIDAYEDRPIVPILQKDETKSLRVTVLTMGNIISVDYVPIKGKKTVYMSAEKSSSDTLLIPTLSENEKIPFLKISKQGIEVFKPTSHQFFDIKQNKGFKAHDNQNIPYQAGDEFCFIHGTVEIRVETVNSPPRIKSSPFFTPDKNLQKESAKVFSAVFAFLLIMMLVNVEQPKEEKKIAVIYRQKVKKMDAKEPKFSKEVAKKKENVGQKPIEQEKPIKEPKMAKKKLEPVKTKKAKTKKVKKKMANKKTKKIPKRSKRVAKKPVKTYKLKLDRSISSFLNKKQNVKVTNVDKSATLKDIGASKLQASSSEISTKSKINLGTFGRDYKGNVSRSTGTKGLSRKRGFDTAYIEPRTVVLGSMDPELLRKILREYLPQFRHCYQKELEHHSNEISGVIDLKFRIGATGKATKVNIKTQNKSFSRKGTGCMSSVLKLIDFPKPKGGGVVDVKQPLNFFSEKGKI